MCFGDADIADLLEPGLAVSVAEAWADNAVQTSLDEAPGSEQLARKLYADMKTTLVSEMLTKVDRMTMAHGLEARVPFLDHHLVEWAFTVPGPHKLRDTEGKLLVKKAMERYLPRDILYRRKQGFNVPMKLWMRRELRDYVRDNLADTHLRRRGIFRTETVGRLLDNHFSGRTDASNKIYSLLMLELWHQHFVDRRSDHARPLPTSHREPGLVS
jgi:asparagine synthase (glutamine-hydrolysing)